MREDILQEYNEIIPPMVMTSLTLGFPVVICILGTCCVFCYGFFNEINREYNYDESLIEFMKW